MFEKRIRSILDQGGIQPRSRLLVAFSGGPDSVFLTEWLIRLGYEIAIAHVNYQLRGEASEADAHFAAEFAGSRNLTFFQKIARPENRTEGIQEWARKQRYDFFETLLAKFECAALVTAHHADDQNETVFLNLLRSKPLSAWLIQAFRNKPFPLVRPLLEISKREILDFLQDENIPYRVDESNAQSDYNRNWIRNLVFPQAVERFPNIQDGFFWVKKDIYAAGLLIKRTLDEIRSGRGLSLVKLSRLPVEVQILLLKAWMSETGVRKGLPESLRESTALLFSLQVGKQISVGAKQFIEIGKDEIFLVSKD